MRSVERLTGWDICVANVENTEHGKAHGGGHGLAGVEAEVKCKLEGQRWCWARR